MPAAVSVSNFVNRNNKIPFAEKNASNSPSARGSSEARQTINNASLSKAERQRRAAAARVSIPVMRLTHLKVEPESDVKGLAAAVASRPASRSSIRGAQPRNTFEDTDFDDTVSSGLSTIEGQARHVPSTTDYNGPSHGLLKTIDVRHCAQQHGGYTLQDDSFQAEGIIPDNWQEIVKTEKGLQTGFSQPASVVDDSDDGRSMYLQDGQEYNNQEDIDTVGQEGEHVFLENQNHIGYNQDHHVEEVPEQASSQSWPNQMLPPPPPPPQLRLTSTFTATSSPTSKSSSYVERPEDEAAPTWPVAKKARVVLDYDPQALKAMSYTDLDKRPFEEDPRTSNTIPPVDEHGIPLTLHRRLGNLSRMKDEDVRAMFLCQKDQEWEDTGVWFISQFETQMRRLMDIRQERRMIALKFEMEVKRRQAAVAAKMGNVEQELRYLKAGGRDLMDKRVSPTT